jgi:probable rRNA maturation factor
MQIKVFNETKSKIPTGVLKRIEKVLDNSKLLSSAAIQSFNHSTINLIVQSSQSITKLNKELFKRNTATDVISVNQPTPNTPYPTPTSKTNKSIKSSRSSKSLLGEIYICPEVIKQNAKKYKVDYNEEFARVVIHGILHLLGFDHKKAYGKSEEKMFEVQETLVKRLRL